MTRSERSGGAELAGRVHREHSLRHDQVDAVNVARDRGPGAEGVVEEHWGPEKHLIDVSKEKKQRLE